MKVPEWSVIAVVGVGGTAFGLGYVAGGRQASTITHELRAARSETASLGARLDEVRKSCESRPTPSRAACADPAPGRDATAEVTQAPPPSSALAERASSPEAFDKTRRLLDRARSTSVWGESESAEFRALLTELAAPERKQLISELLAAINSGKVQSRVDGHPF